MSRRPSPVIGITHSSAELFSFVEERLKRTAAGGREPSFWRLPEEEEERESAAIIGAPSSARFGRKTKDQGGAMLLQSALGGNHKQAIVKVISFGRGARSVQNQLEYIAREGELDLETQDADMIVDKDAIKDLIDEWSVDFRVGETARNSVHMQVSSPYGSDPEAVSRAARAFASELFGGKRDYVLVRHDDTDYPHVHIVAKTMGYDDKVLNVRKADLELWRQVWAEKAREQGIMITASSRRDRAQSRKGERLAVRKMKDRGEVPQYYLSIANDVLSGREFEHKDNVAMTRDEAKNRHKLLGLGLLKAASQTRDKDERAKLLSLAGAVKDQAEAMASTIPLRDEMAAFNSKGKTYKDHQELARAFLEKERLEKTEKFVTASGFSPLRQLEESFSERDEGRGAEDNGRGDGRDKGLGFDR